jgi:zinc resistance-associated protein
MWKKAAVVAGALVVAGSMMVYAQQRSQDGPGGGFGPHGFGGPGMMGGGMMGGMGGWRPSADDMSAFADARIAALHAGLRLNADQDKNWPAFEQAMRDFSKIRIERLTVARDQQPPADPIERLQRRADALTTRGTALKHLADTAAPLYQSLDDAQKHRFAMLARVMRPQGAGGQHGGMTWRERFGGFGHMRDGFHGGARRSGDGDGDSMRGHHGMRGMHDDEDDYRGPL